MGPSNDNFYRENNFGIGIQPKDEDAARKLQVAAVIEQTPLLQEVIKHFDDQITLLKSLDAIEADLSKDPAVFQKEVEANRLAAAKLGIERNWLEAKIHII